MITISFRGGSFLLECLSVSVFRHHNQTAELQSRRLLSVCPEVKPWESKACERVSVSYTASTDNVGLLQELWSRQTNKHTHTHTHTQTHTHKHTHTHKQTCTHTNTHLLPWRVEGGRERERECSNTRIENIALGLVKFRVLKYYKFYPLMLLTLHTTAYEATYKMFNQLLKLNIQFSGHFFKFIKCQKLLE